MSRDTIPSVGDHQPYTAPMKGLRSKSGIFERVVYELSEPLKEQQNAHHTQDYKCNVQRGLCGGGVWIVGFERVARHPQDPILAPTLAFPLPERFFQNWGGSHTPESRSHTHTHDELLACWFLGRLTSQSPKILYVWRGEGLGGEFWWDSVCMPCWPPFKI